jgi:hypothetical protein
VEDLRPGVQVVSVPGHVQLLFWQNLLDHPDCEPGFVASVPEPFHNTGEPRKVTAVFCRYWSKTHPGELRTKANSESTPIDYLWLKDTRLQDEVDALMKELGYDKD